MDEIFKELSWYLSAYRCSEDYLDHHILNVQKIAMQAQQKEIRSALTDNRIKYLSFIQSIIAQEDKEVETDCLNPAVLKARRQLFCDMKSSFEAILSYVIANVGEETFEKYRSEATDMKWFIAGIDDIYEPVSDEDIKKLYADLESYKKEESEEETKEIYAYVQTECKHALSLFEE